jgi:hypothetical protein
MSVYFIQHPSFVQVPKILKGWFDRTLRVIVRQLLPQVLIGDSDALEAKESQLIKVPSL